MQFPEFSGKFSWKIFFPEKSSKFSWKFRKFFLKNFFSRISKKVDCFFIFRKIFLNFQEKTFSGHISAKLGPFWLNFILLDRKCRGKANKTKLSQNGLSVAEIWPKKGFFLNFQEKTLFRPYLSRGLPICSNQYFVRLPPTFSIQQNKAEPKRTTYGRDTAGKRFSWKFRKSFPEFSGKNVFQPYLSQTWSVLTQLCFVG